MNQAQQRNLTMVMDLYELTMANGYFNDGDIDTRVAFDVFYRKNPDKGGAKTNSVSGSIDKILIKADLQYLQD